MNLFEKSRRRIDVLARIFIFPPRGVWVGIAAWNFMLRSVFRNTEKFGDQRYRGQDRSMFGRQVPIGQPPPPTGHFVHPASYPVFCDISLLRFRSSDFSIRWDGLYRAREKIPPHASSAPIVFCRWFRFPR